MTESTMSPEEKAAAMKSAWARELLRNEGVESGETKEERLQFALQLEESRLLDFPKVVLKDEDFSLKDKRIVFVGGGPGDGKYMPWGPRFAALEGANVTNFDINDMPDTDKQFGLYKQVYGESGDVTKILDSANSFTEALHEQVGEEVDFIESRNLLTSNPSPELIDTIRERGEQDPKAVIKKMEENLVAAAEITLSEKGVLLIDNKLYQKIEGKLVLKEDL